MLTLPEALSYGRLDPAAAVRIGELSVAGRLSAEHLRGRSAYPAAVQAAEIAVLSARGVRSEEHTSELQSLMRISYAVFCLKKKKSNIDNDQTMTTPDRRSR